MKLNEYATLDAVGLAELIRSGDLSPMEVTEAAIAAIEALDPRLNALVLRDFPRARATAQGVDRSRPLAGVPFLIKDIDVYTKEWPTTMSSRFYADAEPRADSEIIKRWRAAGTVFLGKTNTPEFAADFFTEPVFRGPTLNPWNPALTVGGSSGGAAAAVASGMVPVAHGSDVGGSIRVPAGCCGLFGLKPSRGLNPVGAHVGEGGGGLDCEHVLSRTVRDSAAFLDATAGPELGAPYRVQRSVKSYLAPLDEPLRRLRIASLARTIDGSLIAPEINEKLGQTEALLKRLGHEVTASRFPDAVAAAAAGEGWSTLWLVDIALAIRDRARELKRPPGPNDIEPLSRHIMRHIERKTALDYMDAKGVAHQITLEMARAFKDFDMILTPTTATLPPQLGAVQRSDTDFDFDHWSAVSYGFAPFSEIFNVTGQPAASLPLFLSASGMPIGMQLVGHQDQDHLLLQLSRDLEQLTQWTDRHPPIWAGL
jgi:amidase